MTDQYELKDLQSIVTPERVKRLRKCLDIIDGYQHFREGQDGFQAMIEVRKLVDELEGELSPYGYCPHCGAPGIARERRPDGNDTCKNHHVYPSRVART